jgi:hypothetical protein
MQEFNQAAVMQSATASSSSSFQAQPAASQLDITSSSLHAQAKAATVKLAAMQPAGATNIQLPQAIAQSSNCSQIIQHRPIPTAGVM